MFTYTVKVYEKSTTTTVKIDSLVETFKIDESLDSAVLRIPRIARANAFARFSPVEVIVNDGNVEWAHWWLVYTPKSELSSYAPTPKYDHTLGLIEPTKWLDKFACGTLTFTQPLGGTRYTLYDVVERLRQLTPFVPYASVSTTRLFTIDSTLATYLDGIEAPQLYMDKKNLREALIEVFRYVNAIPRLQYVSGSWVLSADFINQRHLPFDIESGIIDYNNEASGEDYAQKAEFYHENTFTSDDITMPTVYGQSVVDLISYRNETSIIRGDNYQLVLTNKVERMISCQIGVDTANGIEFYELVDSHLFEKKVYDTLDIESGTYQRQNSIFWQYGSNLIDGLYETFGALILKTAIQNIYEAVTPSAASLYNILVFRVEYLPYVEQMKSEQYREDTNLYGNQANMLDRYATLQVNPQERINSLFQLTKNVYGQIQRLGVDTVAFSRRHRALTTYSGENDGIYSLGDYTEDGYFITKKEVVYFNSFVIARYEMSKNFNRIAQFVNIDKEFRPYEITLSKSDFTLRRNIAMPFQTIEIDNNDDSHTSNAFVTSFMLTFQGGTASLPISSALIRFGVSTPSEAYEDDGSLLPLVISAEKNVFKWKVDLLDTKLSGRRIVGQETIFDSKSFYKQVQVPYTESDGTAEMYKIELYNDYWFIIAQTNVADSYYQKSVVGVSKKLPYADTTKNVALGGVAYGEPITAEVHADLATIISDGSAINGNYYLAFDTKNVYQYDSGTTRYVFVDKAVALKNDAFYTLPTYQVLKDTSEILSFELAIPVVVNKDKVSRYVIGDELIQNNVLIKDREDGLQLYWYVQDEQFSKAETKTIGQTSTSAVSSTITVSNNRLTVPTAVIDTNKNFALADENGNLYIAVNRINYDGTVESSANVQYIYFNFMNERS